MRATTLIRRGKAPLLEGGSYSIIKRGNRVYLEYVSSNGDKVIYASCSASLEPLLKLLIDSIPKRFIDINEVMRLYIAMKVLPFAKDRITAIDILRSMSEFDIVFWFTNILRYGRRAISAFAKLYLGQ